MGYFGSKLFDNDLTLDIKDQLEFGMESKIPISFLISELRLEMHYDELPTEEQHLFWIAASITIWNLGYKNQSVFNKGLVSITKLVSDFKLSDELESELFEIADKLKQNPPKINRKREYYVCPWKIGDVYALPREKDEHESNNINGKYFLLIKRDEYHFRKHVYPIVEVNLADKYKLTEQEINDLDFINVFIDKYDGFGIDRSDRYMNTPNRDEFGYTPETCYEISGNKISDIPKKLIYVGNFKDIKKSDKSNYLMEEHKWQYSANFWQHVEEQLIHKYYHYHRDGFKNYLKSKEK